MVVTVVEVTVVVLVTGIEHGLAVGVGETILLPVVVVGPDVGLLDE